MHIVILANKWWECETMITAILNSSAFPPALSDGTIAAQLVQYPVISTFTIHGGQ
jgi:hypothetical protein